MVIKQVFFRAEAKLKKLNSNIPLYGIIAIAVLMLSIALFHIDNLSFANEEDEWKKEFDELCGHTNEAMALPFERLNYLVERCDRLLSKIEAADNPRKKMYLFRIRKCRDLYQFIVDSIKEGRIMK